MREFGKCHFSHCRSKDLKMITYRHPNTNLTTYSMHCNDCHAAGPISDDMVQAFDLWTDIFYPVTCTTHSVNDKGPYEIR